VAVALEMALWKAIMSRVAPTEQMDLNRINAHIAAAFSIVKRFTDAKRKMTSVKTAVDDAWKTMPGSTSTQSATISMNWRKRDL
jgi:hypothetical protein